MLLALQIIGILIPISILVVFAGLICYPRLQKNWPPLITNGRLRAELEQERRASRIAREELNRFQAAYQSTRGAAAFEKETAQYKAPCLDLLKLEAPITKQVVNKRFAELAKKFHPDMMGGNSATFIRIKAARDEALKLCRE